jgi:glycerate 2-kinase
MSSRACRPGPIPRIITSRLRDDLRAIVAGALRACDPASLLIRALGAHPLPDTDTFNIVAAGKAAQGMADAFVARYGTRTRGIVIARGGHPLPDDASFAAGAAALRLADENRARGERLVVLLSGGASAMLAAPADGVTLEDKIAVTRELLRSGRPIAEINAVRRGLSAIKGGKLALRAGKSITFAISDVHAPIEDDPSVIGSGPTVVTGAAAGEVDAPFVLAGSRRDAMDGAEAEARRLGYPVERIAAPTLGEAASAARAFVELAQARAARHERPICVIASGETTVALTGKTGVGGRNQEFALAAALAMAKIEDVALVSVGTDGIDGPTDAAGAIVDGTTIPRAQAMGLDASAALARHDSHPFFKALGDLVVTGPTGTNVGDLQVLLCRRT